MAPIEVSTFICTPPLWNTWILHTK